MPTSHHTYISDVLGEVRKLHPKSILDVGVGFGKWGFLFREYLDVMNERVLKKDWQTRIDGVEIFEPYIADHQKYIYNSILIGDVCKRIDDLGHYDLIFISDVLEHIEKSKALELIGKLQKKCNHLFVVVPIGEEWKHDKSFAGNKNEAHISVWEKEELSYIWESEYDCGQKKISFLKLKTMKEKSPQIVPCKQRNILLQRCNVWWKGGTGLFTIDVAKSYPEFHHVICFRHDSGMDAEMLEYAKSHGFEVYHVSELSEETLQSINPFVTILHNPGTAGIKNGIGWLKNYPVITWHHSHVRPFFQTKAHIFVSEYLRSFYEKDLGIVPIVKIIPPCIDVHHYMKGPEKSSEKPLVFGAVFAKDVKKFSSQTLRRLMYVCKKNKIELRIVGGQNYIEQGEIELAKKYNIEFLEFMVNLKSFYDSIDCLIYFAEVPDTWGRVITEALASHNYVIARDIGAAKEQINSEEVGMLVNDLEQLELAMEQVLQNVVLGRSKPWYDKTSIRAGDIASYATLRRSLDPILLKIGIMGGGC